ncbi:MAG TPA: IS3 family transposase [Cyclobacteriaceae bacterium]|nr:IS3 family transposase [Cyclobacteriaceae bacterium]
MKKSRFTESQIVAILKEADSGMKVGDVCRQHGISQPTYYKWKSQYGGLGVAEIKRMRELEAEHSKLKRMYADLAMENHALKELIGKKALTPVDRQEAVDWLVKEQTMSVVRACRAVGMPRSAWYRPKLDNRERDGAVMDGINEVIGKHGRWGFWKCFLWLRRRGKPWNHKRVLRVYRAMKLNLPRRAKRRLPTRLGQPLEVPAEPNRRWAMDFMHDTLYCGKRFRTFNLIDEGTREALSIEVDSSLPAERVVRVLDQVKESRPLPEQIRIDNGPELLSAKLVAWAEINNVKLHYIQPGKPTQNAYIERFNRTFRCEVLNAHLFNSLSEVRDIVHHWMTAYNDERPHEALGNVPPSVFRQQQAHTP